MTTRKIVEELEKQGHNVKVYERPDGGLRITEIDGIKFPSSNNKGNDFARNLLNEHLSEKQKKHIRENLPKAQEGKQRTKLPSRARRNPKNPKKPYTPPKKPQSFSPRKGDTEEEKELKRKIRNIRNKLGRRGFITDINILWLSLQRDGLQRLYEKLVHIARKQAGLAYPKAVDALHDYIQVMIKDRYNDIEGVNFFAETIMTDLTIFRKEMLDISLSKDTNKGIYAKLYDIEHILQWNLPFHYITWTNTIKNMILDSVTEARKIANAWNIDLDIE